jgi:F-type H+-transporting ATPase subunit gamma
VRRPEHQRAARASLLIKEWQAERRERRTCAIGNKGLRLPAGSACNVVGTSRAAGRPPHLEGADRPVKVMLDAYREGKIDRRCTWLHAQFINTMKQEP